MNRVVFLQSKLPADLRALRQIADRWNSYGEIMKKQGGGEAIWIFTPHPLNELSRNILVSKLIGQFQSVEKYTSFFARFNALGKRIRAENKVKIVNTNSNSVSWRHLLI
jgi:hypothetical protein